MIGVGLELFTIEVVGEVVRCLYHGQALQLGCRIASFCPPRSARVVSCWLPLFLSVHLQHSSAPQGCSVGDYGKTVTGQRYG